MTKDISKSRSHVERKTEDPSCTSSGFYPCKECSKKGTSKNFPSQWKLNAHLKQCHSSSGFSFSCGICFKSFRDNISLTRHKFVHTEAHKISCSICHKTYSRSFSLQEHMFTAHKVKTGNWNYSKCDLCSKEFAGVARLEAQVIEKHVVDKEFACSICSKKFIDLQSLDRHRKAMHKSITGIFTCDICSAEFAFKRYLPKHLKYSHPNNTFCLKCERTFINKLQYSQHLETKTSPENQNSEAFKCQICHLKCTSQCNFDWHAESHIQKLKSEAAQSQSQTETKAEGGLKFKSELFLKLLRRGQTCLATGKTFIASVNLN